MNCQRKMNAPAPSMKARPKEPSKAGNGVSGYGDKDNMERKPVDDTANRPASGTIVPWGDAE